MHKIETLERRVIVAHQKLAAALEGYQAHPSGYTAHVLRKARERAATAETRYLLALARG